MDRVAVVAGSILISGLYAWILMKAGVLQWAFQHVNAMTLWMLHAMLSMMTGCLDDYLKSYPIQTEDYTSLIVSIIIFRGLRFIYINTTCFLKLRMGLNGEKTAENGETKDIILPKETHGLDIWTII